MTLKLSVVNLDRVGKRVDLVLEPAWGKQLLADTDISWNTANQSGSFKGHVQRLGQKILLRGDLKASLMTACVRCLGDARVDVNVEVTLLFHPMPEVGTRAKCSTRHRDSEVHEPGEDEVADAFYSGDALELDEVFREQLLLEVPMQPLCSPDCPGIPIPEALRAPTKLV